VSNLLKVNRLPVRRDNPLLMEFEVQPKTAPYLVTSTKSVMWISEPMAATPELWPQGTPENVVRVAVRPGLTRSLGDFFWEVTQVVENTGRELEWGNVHPFTEEGIALAVDHVAYYELGDLCLLIPRDESSLPLKDIAMDLGLLPQPCSWLPADTALVVPKNREYVGFLGLLGRKGAVGLVHNAARSIGVARGSSE
jgi:hypothetical protein